MQGVLIPYKSSRWDYVSWSRLSDVEHDGGGICRFLGLRSLSQKSASEESASRSSTFEKVPRRSETDSYARLRLKREPELFFFCGCPSGSCWSSTPPLSRGMIYYWPPQAGRTRRFWFRPQSTADRSLIPEDHLRRSLPDDAASLKNHNVGNSTRDG